MSKVRLFEEDIKGRMHGMVNITRNLKRYDIEPWRRPIVSTANYDFRPV